MKLSEFMIKKRKELNLSLRGLAELLDISHAFLDSIEKDRDPRTGKPISPTIDTMQKIAKGLNMNLSDLLEITEYIEPRKSWPVGPSTENWDALPVLDRSKYDISNITDDEAEMIVFMRSELDKLNPEQRRKMLDLAKFTIAFSKEMDKKKLPETST